MNGSQFCLRLKSFVWTNSLDSKIWHKEIISMFKRPRKVPNGLVRDPNYSDQTGKRISKRWLSPIKAEKRVFLFPVDFLSVCSLYEHEVTYSQKICIFTFHWCSFFALPKIPRDVFAFLKNYDIKIQIMKIKHDEEIQAYHSSEPIST